MPFTKLNHTEIKCFMKVERQYTSADQRTQKAQPSYLVTVVESN